MSQSLFPKQRQERIAAVVKEQGSIRVDELSRLLEVSDITIRRDLADLEKKGVLERTHGGAISMERLTVEAPYAVKDKILGDSKAAIGKTAAALVEPGETVFINSGSTTLQVIIELARRGDTTIITNNAAALSLSEASLSHVFFTGGKLRPSSHTFVGAFAVRSLEEVNVSKAIIGVDGLSLRSGLTSPVLEEAEITRAGLARVCGKVILAADHSKIGKISSFTIAPVQEADILVTDRKLNEDIQTELKQTGLEILLTE